MIREFLKPINRDILLQAPEQDKAKLPDGATVVSWMDAAAKISGS